jgi:Ca2+:H+ antiporter
VQDAFSAVALTVSVIHSSIITNDAISHWLLGAQLISVYIIIAICFYYR